MTPLAAVLIISDNAEKKLLRNPEKCYDLDQIGSGNCGESYAAHLSEGRTPKFANGSDWDVAESRESRVAQGGEKRAHHPQQSCHASLRHRVIHLTA